jgi:hypothetical protein
VGTTTAGVLGIGLVDDPDPVLSAGTGSTLTYSAVDEFRCSHADSVYREMEVEWKPLDKTVWYYTTPSPASSVADQRDQYQVGFSYAGAYLPAVSTTLGVLQLYYDITFEGADDPNVNLP